MIKKITLMCVVAMLCLVHDKGSAQNLEIVPFQIGQRIPDLPLKNIINYQDSNVSKLSAFGNKIIILDFWGIYCTTCIKMFPLEDSLQRLFAEDVQFILVTQDTKKEVESFLEKYKQKRGDPLRLPILVDDNLLYKLFPFTYIPHYVWIAPNGQILAKTSHALITEDALQSAIDWSKAYIKRIRSYNLPEIKFRYPEPGPELKKLINQINQ